MTTVAHHRKREGCGRRRGRSASASCWSISAPPTAPTRSGVRVYLKEFLSDPRVIENQGLLWKLALNGVILRTRPAPQGARLPEDLEYREERIAAQDHHARAVRQACGRHRRPRPCRGRLGDALRQSVDPLADRRPDGAGLRPAPGGAALSAIFGRDLGDRLRRGVSRARRHARAADLAGDAALLRRSGLHRGARGLDQCASEDAAVPARTDRGLVPRHAAEIHRQGRSLSGAMHRDDGGACANAWASMPRSCC